MFSRLRRGSMSSMLRRRFGIPGVISRFHDRFGTAGVVIAVIALVAALGGTAIAAGGLTPKQKKEVTKIAKKYAGKPGAPGANGTAGAKGDAGAAGTNGTNGTDGANGKTVLSGTATPTVAVGTLGDFYIETDVNKIYGPKAASGANGGWGTGTDLKGPEGDPWTAGGTLPVGATETGAWAFGTLPAGALPGASGLRIPLSFTIRLATDLAASKVHFINAAGNESRLNESTFEPEEIENPPNCLGSVAAPSAVSGHLCIYTKTLIGAIGFSNFEGIFSPSSATAGGSKAGAILRLLNVEGNSSGFGTWAVTG